uniref:Uncharacterized protein n=1 Tax=Cacopsylla melanoneura TaxID=428564 RepID=A0A8D9ABF4_9HEMI
MDLRPPPNSPSLLTCRAVQLRRSLTQTVMINLWTRRRAKPILETRKSQMKSYSGSVVLWPSMIRVKMSAQCFSQTWTLQSVKIQFARLWRRLVSLKKCDWSKISKD